MLTSLRKRAITSKTPVSYATQQDKYEYRHDPHVKLLAREGGEEMYGACYVVESCYSRDTLQKWEDSFPRLKEKLHMKSKHTLPAPGLYKVIDVLFRSEVTRLVNAGRGPYGEARDKKDGRPYTTYPGVKFILINGASIYRGTTTDKPYRKFIKAVFSLNSLGQEMKPPAWIDDRVAAAGLNDAAPLLQNRGSDGSVRNRGASPGRSTTIGADRASRKGSAASGAESRLQSNP